MRSRAGHREKSGVTTLTEIDVDHAMSGGGAADDQIRGDVSVNLGTSTASS